MAPILGARLRLRFLRERVRFVLSRRFRDATRNEFGTFANRRAYLTRKYGFFGTRAQYRAQLDEEAA